MRIQWKKLLVLTLAAALLGANLISMAQESAQSRKFSVISISGDEAYVTRGAGKEVKAAAGMPLGQGSTIRTGALTSVYVEADEDRIIRLDSNTQVEITKATSKSLKITLKSGEIFFNVDKPLKAGEEMTFDAAQTSMSIRGTSGVLSCNGDTASLYLVEGKVEWKIGNQTVNLTGGEVSSALRGGNGAYSAQVDKAGLNKSGTNNSQKTTVSGEQQRETDGIIIEPRAFTWEDLPPGGLQAVLEQSGRLELSAIGLGNRQLLDQATARMEQMRKEKEERERQQMEKEAAARQAAGSGGTSVRVDGKEPEIPVSEDRGSGDGGWREPETSVNPPTSTEPPIVEDPPTSTAPPTSVDPPASTEPPTVVDPPTSTEPPTPVDPPTSTEPPTSVDPGDTTGGYIDSNGNWQSGSPE